MFVFFIVLFDRTTGKSKQIGFVRFKDVKNAEIAMRLMNGYRPNPQSVPWSVRFVESEEEKKGWSLFFLNHTHHRKKKEDI
jgi:hypothetical protein